MPADQPLPDRARIVVIGGGVGGTSIAFHLAERGETDVLLVERDELTSGSTFHSAGLVGQLRADPTLTAMNTYSVDLYRRLQQTDVAPGWVEAGGIRLASSVQRMEEIRRQISWARGFDLALHEISAAQAQQMFPLLDTQGVVGGAYLASDGWVDPSMLCQAMATLARRKGVTVVTGTRVSGIDTTDGRVRTVRTERGDVECELVVNAGGMFAAEIGRLAGVRVPLVPMSHQYLVTDALLPSALDGRDHRDHPLPTLRDPDLLVYYRQEGDGLVMGGYERDPEPFCTTGTGYDAIPADFNAKLLPHRWERLEEIAHNSQRRVPAMADAGITTMVNGPEAFTPDNEFCLGETAIDGLFVAAGFCAHGIAGAGGIGRLMADWMLDGEPGRDVSHMDIGRFGRQYASPAYTMARARESYQTYYDIRYPAHERTAGRPLRIPPAYGWHREHGAEMGEKAGWERVSFYADNEAAGAESLRPHGWAGRHWSPATGAEHLGTRAAAGLFDESSFAKIEVAGRDAAALLEWVCDSRVAREVGAVTYTQLLNTGGGIEADLTVTRTGAEEFLVVTGTAFGAHDLDWLGRQARRRGHEARISDVTGQLVCYALWGPNSRDILAALTPAGLDDDSFGFLTSQQTTVGDVPVRALRVTYTGELGWELYAPTEYGLRLWELLWDAGGAHGLVAAGYRAIDSLRLEKGYRAWGTDVTPETTPYEAGLGFCVALDKPGGFLGRDGLVAARRREQHDGSRRRLRCLVLDDPRQIALGGEPVRLGANHDDKVAGRVTSGGFGYSVGTSIAYAYLPAAESAAGTPVAVDLFGAWVDGRVVTQPVFDPSNARVRGQNI